MIVFVLFSGTDIYYLILIIRVIQGHKETAAEKLRELALSRDNGSRSPGFVNEAKDVSNTNELLVLFLLCFGFL